MNEKQPRNFFTILCEGKNFILFMNKDYEFFIAESENNENPRLDSAKPILIRSVDREYCLDLKPRQLDIDTPSYMTPIGEIGVTEIFKEDISSLPEAAQEFLLEYFKKRLDNSEKFYAV